MLELGTAALIGVVLTGATMLLRDDMLGRRHATDVETRLREQLAGIERRFTIYEADAKSILKEVSELKGLFVSYTQSE